MPLFTSESIVVEIFENPIQAHARIPNGNAVIDKVLISVSLPLLESPLSIAEQYNRIPLRSNIIFIYRRVQIVEINSFLWALVPFGVMHFDRWSTIVVSSLFLSGDKSEARVHDGCKLPTIRSNKASTMSNRIHLPSVIQRAMQWSDGAKQLQELE